MEAGSGCMQTQERQAGGFPAQFAQQNRKNGQERAHLCVRPLCGSRFRSARPSCSCNPLRVDFAYESSSREGGAHTRLELTAAEIQQLSKGVRASARPPARARRSANDLEAEGGTAVAASLSSLTALSSLDLRCRIRPNRRV